MKAAVFVGFLVFVLAMPAQAEWGGKCTQFRAKPAYLEAIGLLAKRMQYTPEELCQLPRLADIFFSETSLFNKETQEDEPHLWVTFHYFDYSCQYYIRKADRAVTRKNCYNTW
jgi:hypothetical protein